MSDLDADAIRNAMAEAIHAADCPCGDTLSIDPHTPDVAEWYAELANAAFAVVQLKTNQPGGEWVTEYGVRYISRTEPDNTWTEWPAASTWSPGYADALTSRWEDVSGVVIHRDVWRGPAESVQSAAAV